MSEYQLVIAQAPKSMNAGGAGYKRHHFAAHREKKTWQTLFEMSLLAAKVPKGMVFCEVDVLIEWKEKRRRDVANWYAPVTKPLYDALVNGWLPDDTAEYIELTGFRFRTCDPAAWPYRDPRVKARLVVTLRARYNPPVVDPHGA